MKNHYKDLLIQFLEERGILTVFSTNIRLYHSNFVNIDNLVESSLNEPRRLIKRAFPWTRPKDDIDWCQVHKAWLHFLSVKEGSLSIHKLNKLLKL